MSHSGSIRLNEDRICRFRQIFDDGFRLAIEVTRQCNLSCKHCFVSPSRNKPTTEEIIDVIQQAKQLNCRKIILTGGEPLLRHDLEQIVSAATSLGILVDLNSNFFNLTRERVNRLKVAGLQEVSVSLYGGECFHDELTRKKGSFERVLQGINILHEVGITVDVHGAVWNKMLPCIPDLINTAQKYDVSSITFFSMLYTEIWKNIDEYILSHALALQTILQARKSTSMPIRTIGLRKIEKDECSMGNGIYGIDNNMHLVPCLLSRHINNKNGIDLRVHCIQKALFLLENQIQHGEWCATCYPQI